MWVCFCLNEKKAILSFVTKRATGKFLKFTAQFLYFLSAEKFFKDPNSVKCLIFSWLTISQHLISLLLNHATLVSISFYQLLMKFIHFFDDGFEAGSAFLDISKTFDKVCHEGIIFKIKQNGISDDLLNILSDFLRNRK